MIDTTGQATATLAVAAGAARALVRQAIGSFEPATFGTWTLLSSRSLLDRPRACEVDAAHRGRDKPTRVSGPNVLQATASSRRARIRTSAI